MSLFRFIITFNAVDKNIFLEDSVCIFYFQWLNTYCKRIADIGAFEGKMPNHVLVNEYLSGQGIMVCIIFLSEVFMLTFSICQISF